MNRIGTWIVVNDNMQIDYKYEIIAPEGKNFHPTFNPDLSPKTMLELGVFEGKYLNDCKNEFPIDWFENARISNISDPSMNCFGLKSRQSLQIWRQQGWIIGSDPRGWFQWYCRYFQGRRDESIDNIQIKRWKSFIRHSAQIRKNCIPKDISCRPRQRQAILQWAYDPFI